MKEKTFQSFWNKIVVEEWLNHSTVKDGENSIYVKDLCYLKDSAVSAVFELYEKNKVKAKNVYFKDMRGNNGHVYLSRYKRAAVLTYAVIQANPIELKTKKSDELLDKYFLKQRLAFFVGLQSIIQDYPEDEICKKKGEGSIFFFSSLGESEREEEEDDFLTSVYKDLLFSELYHNYNILTMANVFGLLTERASVLGEIAPKPAK